MKEYHKIETLFERDEKTKKLIINKFRNETVEFLKNNQWVFTEKVDGTNIRIVWDGHKVSFLGRTDKAQIPVPLLNKLNKTFGGDINEQMFEQKFGETPVTLYGEGYGEGIQKGGNYRKDVDFILFDVEIGDLFLKRVDVEDIANYFSIDIVPVCLVGNIQEGLDYVLNNKTSLIAQYCAEIEGVVGRPLIEVKDRRGNRVIVKIKRKDFNL